jgi:uncharacterized protein YndB with AHSA1/START domain
MNAEAPAVCVTRRFSAPPERVFDAWLDPDKIKLWFAPGLGEMVRIAVESRVGGTFSFVQRRDGTNVDHTGEYQEFVRPTRLVFTWGVPQSSPDRSRVIIDIAPQPGGCELTLTHELHPHWADYAERTKDAWTKMLAAMADALT